MVSVLRTAILASATAAMTPVLLLLVLRLLSTAATSTTAPTLRWTILTATSTRPAAATTTAATLTTITGPGASGAAIGGSRFWTGVEGGFAFNLPRLEGPLVVSFNLIEERIAFFGHVQFSWFLVGRLSSRSHAALLPEISNR